MIAMRSVRFIVLMSPLLVACADDTDCSPPAAPGYTCEPTPSSAASCIGGPVFDGWQRDADKSFPIGCSAGFFHCTEGGEIEMTRQCECQLAPGSATPSWVCPL